jgi:hypothetical protein
VHKRSDRIPPGFFVSTNVSILHVSANAAWRVDWPLSGRRWMHMRGLLQLSATPWSFRICHLQVSEHSPLPAQPTTTGHSTYFWPMPGCHRHCLNSISSIFSISRRSLRREAAPPWRRTHLGSQCHHTQLYHKVVATLSLHLSLFHHDYSSIPFSLSSLV